MIRNLLDWRGILTTEPAGFVSIALFFFLHAHININSLSFLDEAKLASELLIRFCLGDRTKTIFLVAITSPLGISIHMCMHVACMCIYLYVCVVGAGVGGCVRTSSVIVFFSFLLFSTLCMSLIGRFVIILERTNCASRRLCTSVNVVKEHNSVNAENKHECFVI